MPVTAQAWRPLLTKTLRLLESASQMSRKGSGAEPGRRVCSLQRYSVHPEVALQRSSMASVAWIHTCTPLSQGGSQALGEGNNSVTEPGLGAWRVSL